MNLFVGLQRKSASVYAN